MELKRGRCSYTFGRSRASQGQSRLVGGFNLCPQPLGLHISICLSEGCGATLGCSEGAATPEGCCLKRHASQGSLCPWGPHEAGRQRWVRQGLTEAGWRPLCHRGAVQLLGQARISLCSPRCPSPSLPVCRPWVGCPPRAGRQRPWEPGSCSHLSLQSRTAHFRLAWLQGGCAGCRQGFTGDLSPVTLVTRASALHLAGGSCPQDIG